MNLSRLDIATVLPCETRGNAKQIIGPSWQQIQFTALLVHQGSRQPQASNSGLVATGVGRYLARITVEDDLGSKNVRWVPLKAGTAAEAVVEFRTLLVERSENRLHHIGTTPKFSDYLQKTYLPWLDTSGKKPDSLTTEKGHLSQWEKSIGHLRLDKIRPHHINAHLTKLAGNGRANRTCNLSLSMLRNLLKNARVDGFIKSLPVAGIPWRRTEQKARRLYTREDINRLGVSGGEGEFRIVSVLELNPAKCLG